MVMPTIKSRPANASSLSDENTQLVNVVVTSRAVPDPTHWERMELLFPTPEIDMVNPQRFEMHQLDGILALDTERHEVLGFKQLEGNTFTGQACEPVIAGPRWLEVAAQAAAFYLKRCVLCQNDVNFGIGGIYDLEFHRDLLKGQRLYVQVRAVMIDLPASARIEFEGYVDSTLFFTGGMLLLPLKYLNTPASR